VARGAWAACSARWRVQKLIGSRARDTRAPVPRGERSRSKRVALATPYRRSARGERSRSRRAALATRYRRSARGESSRSKCVAFATRYRRSACGERSRSKRVAFATRYRRSASSASEKQILRFAQNDSAGRRRYSCCPFVKRTSGDRWKSGR